MSNPPILSCFEDYPQISPISQIQKKDSHEKAQKAQKKSSTQDRLNKNSLLLLISF
jgi:hypothetical protein